MGLYATSVTFGAPVKPVAATDAEVRARIEDQRALIGEVPGEGSVLGVWVFGANTYAFRNKSGSASTGMYQSSSTGWTEIDLGQVLNFDGTTQNGEPVPGNIGSPTTIKGGTSGAEGALMGISYHGLWETGATGAMVLKDITGTFQDNEDLQMPLLAFNSGSIEIEEGDSIKGAASGQTATVTSVTLTGGAWDGSAAGQISVRDNSGTWNASEAIQVGGVTRANVNGASQPTNVKIAVADGVLYSQTINPGGTYEFVTYNFRGDTSGISMYGVNGVDKGFAFDGITFVKNFSGQPTDEPQHVHAHQKHLFYSYANGSIQNSSIIAPNKWATTTGAAELSIGDVVSGFSTEVNNVMSVFTRNDAYMLYGSSAADWSLRRFHAGAGAIPYTIQKMDQTFFLDDRGLTSIFTVQYFGDFQSAVASDKVDPYIQAKKENTVTSLRVRGKNQYRIYFDDKTGLEMTFINKTNQGLMPFTLVDQIVCTCSVEDTNGFEVLYGGFDDGYVRRLDSGTSFDGATVDSFIRSAYYHYDAPGMRKRFREVNLEINADTSTTLTVFPDYDFGGTFDPRTSPVSDAYTVNVTADDWNEDDVSNPDTGVTVVASQRLKINGIGTNMSLIIKNSSIYDKPITLQGAIVDYSPRGIRR
ncbi:MAG: hypothetical protein MK386_07710 [Candidatus Thioglobus autotrophicus]|nr:hypothetical protein [Candidatus Thioglobus autotrophicus]